MENVIRIRVNIGSLSLYYLCLQCSHKPRKPQAFQKQRLIHSSQELSRNHSSNELKHVHVLRQRERDTL